MTGPTHLNGKLRLFAILALAAVGTASWVGWAQVGSAGIVHGCVASSGLIRGIDETTGSCRSSDQTLSWYSVSGADAVFGSKASVAALQSDVVGAQNAITGIQTQLTALQSASLTSFNQLHGLPCTRNGSVGVISIIYNEAGDARLNCVLSPSDPPPGGPPSGNFSGIYNLTNDILYSCDGGVGIVLVIDGFTLWQPGTNLIVSPRLAGGGTEPVDMTGVVSGNSFSVVGVRTAGSVVETYSLNGVFQTNNTFTGTFQVTVEGESFFNCPNQSYAVQGSR